MVEGRLWPLLLLLGLLRFVARLVLGGRLARGLASGGGLPRGGARSRLQIFMSEKSKNIKKRLQMYNLKKVHNQDPIHSRSNQSCTQIFMSNKYKYTTIRLDILFEGGKSRHYSISTFRFVSLYRLKKH